MSYYPEPQYSRSRVDRAGYAAAVNNASEDDISVIENWRAAHAHVLNTFKQIIYNRSKKFEFKVVQRLKRRPTIVSKLSRDPTMNVRLSQMQDIAGCRIIFEKEDQLYAFKDSLGKSRFDHKLLYEKDYIKQPKADGYEGVHQIYSYNIDPTRNYAGQRTPWNKLRVEIQYRTSIQNTWATAVEAAGLLTESNPKLKAGDEDFIIFFAVAREMISRANLHRNSCLPGLTDEDLLVQFERLKQTTHILDIFEKAVPQIKEYGDGTTYVLVFYYKPGKDGVRQTDVQTFQTVLQAISKYNELESSLAGEADVVLVRAEDEGVMRAAYKNYFADTAEFVSVLNSAAYTLEPNA